MMFPCRSTHAPFLCALSSQVVGCLCPKGFSGKFCGNTTDVCKGKPCFPGVQCQSQGEPDQFTCGECPSPTIYGDKQGYKCFENGWYTLDNKVVCSLGTKRERKQVEATCSLCVACPYEHDSASNFFYLYSGNYSLLLVRSVSSSR